MLNYQEILNLSEKYTEFYNNVEPDMDSVSKEVFDNSFMKKFYELVNKSKEVKNIGEVVIEFSLKNGNTDHLMWNPNETKLENVVWIMGFPMNFVLSPSYTENTISLVEVETKGEIARSKAEFLNWIEENVG